MIDSSIGKRSGYHIRTTLIRFFVYLLLAIILVIVVLPIWLLLVNSTRSTNEIQLGISLLPSKYLIANYKYLLGIGVDMVTGFKNSVFLAFSTTVLTVYFGMLTAYGLKVYKFPGSKFIYNMILILVMLPMQMSIIGFYQYMSRFGLTDNYIPLIIPSIASAGSVFFAKQYLDSILIKDLIDAARIDGATEIGIFHRVMLPIAVPGMFTLGIFSFVASWNNFFNTFIMISSTSKFTLPMMMQLLQGDVYRKEYGSIYLGMAITIVPIIIFYAVFSRFIVSGIAMGAVKE